MPEAKDPDAEAKNQNTKVSSDAEAKIPDAEAKKPIHKDKLRRRGKDPRCKQNNKQNNKQNPKLLKVHRKMHTFLLNK
ncbi:hypothetical protein [Methanolobus sp. ZRKC5]|uniref:hypothetical protein n=1 Tax=unclassified Methanolobus TaxID=2629569 RepID=UPI00313B31FB